MPLTRCRVAPTRFRHEREKLLIVFVERSSGEKHLLCRREMPPAGREIGDARMSAFVAAMVPLAAAEIKES
jgi:hypothetical protein